MFDHVGLVFSDLKKGRGLHRPLLETIGIRLMEDHTQPDGAGWLVFRAHATMATQACVAGATTALFS